MPSIPQNFYWNMDGIWYAVETCWSDEPHAILSQLISFHGREPNFGGSIKNNFNVGLHSDIYRLISVKLGLMMDTTLLYCFIPVWIFRLWPSFKVTVLRESRNFYTHCLTGEIWYVAMTWLVQAHARFCSHLAEVANVCFASKAPVTTAALLVESWPGLELSGACH